MEDRFLARGSVDFGDFCLFVDEIAQFYSRSLDYSNGMMLGMAFGIIGLCFQTGLINGNLNRKQMIESQIEYTLSDGIIRHTHRFGFCEGNRGSICHLTRFHHLQMNR